MTVYLISDTHFNHQNIATYCDRPPDFTEIIIKRWHEIVKPEDLVIHLGDVMIGGRKSSWIMPSLPGRKILIRGNHDRQNSCTWWMEHGFDAACDGMKFRNAWLTHEPSTSLADGCEVNIHGHLHNFFDKGTAHKDFKCRPFHRLFAIEYTDYRPVEFDKFVFNPVRFKADIYSRASQLSRV